MKALTLLCFTLFACSQIYASSKAESKAEILSLIQTKYTIDDVLKVLQTWQGSTQDDLNELDNNYNTYDPQLAAQVNNANDLLGQKIASCDAIDNLIEAGQAAEQQLQSYVDVAQSTIDSNIVKSEAAADARCASNLLFISELGSKEEAAVFLNYLRGAISSPAFLDYLSSQESALIQLKSAMSTKQENEILSLIAKHQMLSLIQTKSKKTKQDYEGESNLSSQLNAGVRTASQVGSDYQDNDRGALSVQGVSSDYQSPEQYVQQLVGYIDQLLQNLDSDAEKLQEVETNAVQAFIDYRRLLADQNKVLEQFIVVMNQAINELDATNAANKEAAQQCRDEVVPLQENVQTADENKSDYEQNYAQRRQALVERLALFAQAIQVYQDEVINAADSSAKGRADDYLDNQQFDDSTYTARTPIPAAP